MNEPIREAARPTLRVSASRRTAILALRHGNARTVVLPHADVTPQRGADLPARVAAFLAEHDVDVRDLDAVAVDVGPGSYTGLRVAVTFARFVSAFTGARLERFTSLELLAAGAWRDGTVPVDCAYPENGKVRLQVVLDARRGRVHTGVVELTADRAHLVDGPRAEELAEFRAVAPLLVEPALIDTLRAHCDSRERPMHALTEPNAGWLFDPRLEPQAVEAEQIEPLYLMGTYADD